MFDGALSPFHIILVLAAALIIFGPKRLPDIGKSLGKGIKEFKGALNHLGDDDEAAPAPTTTVVTTPVVTPVHPAQVVETPATPAAPVAPGPVPAAESAAIIDTPQA